MDRTAPAMTIWRVDDSAQWKLCSPLRRARLGQGRGAHTYLAPQVPDRSDCERLML